MKNYGNNPDTEGCYENSYIGGILTFKNEFGFIIFSSRLVPLSSR